MKKMRGVTLTAEWSPKPEFKLGAKDIDKVSTYLGSLVWKNPRIEIRDYDIPEQSDKIKKPQQHKTYNCKFMPFKLSAH
jgi:hypothetical protein